MQIELKTVAVLTLSAKEAEHALASLEAQLAGPRTAYVILNSESYRNLWAQLTRRPISYTLTWTEGLRVRAYLAQYVEKDKKHDVRITPNVLRDMPIYR
jgi:hypothetical protein